MGADGLLLAAGLAFSVAPLSDRPSRPAAHSIVASSMLTRSLRMLLSVGRSLWAADDQTRSISRSRAAQEVGGDAVCPRRHMRLRRLSALLRSRFLEGRSVPSSDERLSTEEGTASRTSVGGSASSALVGSISGVVSPSRKSRFCRSPPDGCIELCRDSGRLVQRWFGAKRQQGRSREKTANLLNQLSTGGIWGRLRCTVVVLAEITPSLGLRPRYMERQ
eukprot:3230744-Prymnesium_polylepis.1